MLKPATDTAVALSGAQVRRLMRQHRQTIKGLAQAHGLTQKRIREVRRSGVDGFLAEEWHWMITSVWPTDAGGRWLV